MCAKGFLSIASVWTARLLSLSRPNAVQLTAIVPVSRWCYSKSIMYLVERNEEKRVFRGSFRDAWFTCRRQTCASYLFVSLDASSIHTLYQHCSLSLCLRLSHALSFVPLPQNPPKYSFVSPVVYFFSTWNLFSRKCFILRSGKSTLRHNTTRIRTDATQRAIYFSVILRPGATPSRLVSSFVEK